MSMGMGMNMTWGRDQRQIMQMKLSPRVEDPNGGSDLARLLFFTGRTVQNRKGPGNDDEQRSEPSSTP